MVMDSLSHRPAHRLPVPLLGLIVVVALAGTLLPKAGAQNTVAVSPAGVLLQGDAGQTLNGTLRLDNPTSDDAAVTTSIQDFSYDSAGELTFHPAGSVAGSAASWVTVNPASSTVSARGNERIRYSVDIPADAEPGTHWAVVFFETGTANPPTAGDTLATFKVRIGCVLYVDVGKGSAAGKIAGIVGAGAKGDIQYQFAIQYLNSGNLVSLLNGRVDVRNSDGDTVVSIPISREVALPGSVRLLNANMVGPLPAGDYDALVILEPNNMNEEVAGEYPFHLDHALSAPPAPPATAGKNGASGTSGAAESGAGAANGGPP